jgi:nucleotide-binding universal stress UspA family protein
VLSFRVGEPRGLKETRVTEHILVPLDGSAFAAAALPHAAALARMFGARLTLAQVPEAMVVPIADAGVWLTRVVESSAARDEAERELAAAASSPELDGLEVRTTTPDYPVAEGLLGAIEEVGADLVVMTSHGRSAPGQWLLGNVAQKLLHHAPVPVYLVRPSQAAEAPIRRRPPSNQRWRWPKAAGVRCISCGSRQFRAT